MHDHAVGPSLPAHLEALATVISPLIGVPVLIGLVYVALWLKRAWFTTGSTQSA